MPNGVIERTHSKLSVGAQGQLLSISRSSFYHAPQGETALNLDLMLKVDKQFLDTLFYGVRHPLGRLLCNRLPGNG
jgi:putative transposase